MRPGRVVFGSLLWSAAAWAQQYVISTVAGGAPAPPFAISSFGVGADSAGNVYFTSSTLKTVSRLDPNGAVTRVAGNSRTGSLGDGGPATEAQLNNPNGVAVDGAGNLFIADTGNHRVRRVSKDGTIVTVAGNGVCCFSGDGGPAVNAQLQTPFAVAVDTTGNLFIADEYNQRIRKVSVDGIITTVAGNGTSGFSGDGEQGTGAQLSYPTGVAVDSAGRLFIADYNNHRVRMLSADGIITTAAGNGGLGSSGDGGPAVDAQLTRPLALAVDGADNLFIADVDRIRRVSRTGAITTVAGGGTSWGTSSDGGLATNAALQPYAVAADGSGNLFIAENVSSSIRKVSTSGIISTVASKAAACCFFGDGGPALSALLNDPAGVALDGAGNFYIADALNSRIRKVSTEGTIATVGDGCGPPDDYDAPCGIAADSHGNIYVSDEDGVRKISADGTTTKLYSKPSYGIAVDSAGNLYIADQFSCHIYRISQSGEMTTIAGNGTCGYAGDGGSATSAQIFAPLAMAVDRAGNIYFVDEGATIRIRRVSADGIVTTVAGGGSGDLLDGSLATGGSLHEVIGLAADSAGNLYFQEFSVFYPDVLEIPRRVRKISSDGVVTTIAGTGEAGYSGDGGPAILALLGPAANERGNNLAVDSLGNLYVADGGNNVIRLLRPLDHSIVIAAVLDAASERPNQVSPGKIVVVYGSGIGPSELMENQPVDGRIGTELDGTVVSFDGIAAPILYTSALQVAAIVPYAITGTTAQVTVSYQGSVSAANAVDVAPSAPSIFTFNGTGAGQAAAVNAVDGTANTAANPVKIGAYISLYATGEGQTIPAGVDGKLGGPTVAKPALPVTATVGGLPATILYAESVPGQVAGLMQVNVQIPAGVQPGGYVPVVLTVGDRSSSPAVWIAVSGN